MEKSGTPTAYLVFVLINFLFDISFEIIRHGIRQIGGIVICFRNPSVNAVELDNDARPSASITEIILLGTLGSQKFNIKVAHCVFWG